MALGTWLRLIETASGLASVSRTFRRRSSSSEFPETRTAGGLEARLAGVLIAALKEAFDRDRNRLDLERTHLEAERQRAEEALRLEASRQAADRSLAQARTIIIIAVVVWVTSAVLATLLPGMRDVPSTRLLAIGWGLIVATLGCAFVASHNVTAWASHIVTNAELAAAQASHPAGLPGVLLPWLVIGGLGFTAASVLTGL